MKEDDYRKSKVNKNKQLQEQKKKRLLMIQEQKDKAQEKKYNKFVQDTLENRSKDNSLLDNLENKEKLHKLQQEEQEKIDNLNLNQKPDYSSMSYEDIMEHDRLTTKKLKQIEEKKELEKEEKKKQKKENRKGKGKIVKKVFGMGMKKILLWLAGLSLPIILIIVVIVILFVLISGTIIGSMATESIQKQLISEGILSKEDLSNLGLDKITLTDNNRGKLTSNGGTSSGSSGNYNFTGLPKATVTNETQAQFINEISPGAVATWLDYKILPSVVLGQAILESSWGNSDLAKPPNHNLFGIKGTGTNGSVIMNTREQSADGGEYYIDASFAKYHNYGDSIVGHGKFLTVSDTSKRYSKAIGEKDAEKSVSAIREGGYATDLSYVSLVMGIIKENNLTIFDDYAFTQE